jgi:hypothetical protein
VLQPVYLELGALFKDEIIVAHKTNNSEFQEQNIPKYMIV